MSTFLPVPLKPRNGFVLQVLVIVRISTVQRLSRAGLRAIAPHAIALAAAEGLRAHADSIRIRL